MRQIKTKHNLALIVILLLAFAISAWAQLNCSGGPLNCTGFTSGSVPYVNSAGALAQANTTFFWNAANSQLIIGGNTLGSNTYKLQLDGPTGVGSSKIFALSRTGGFGATEFAQYYTSGASYGLDIADGLLKVDIGANRVSSNKDIQGTTFSTATNCADSAGAAACGSAAAGSVVVDAAGTSTVVSTTAVTANSQIFLQVDAGLGTRLGITCNTQAASVFNPRVTARTAATSFTITVDAGPTTDPLCLSFFVIN